MSTITPPTNEPEKSLTFKGQGKFSRRISVDWKNILLPIVGSFGTRRDTGIGRVIEIDVLRKRFALKVPETNREIWITYSPDYLGTLQTNVGELVEIHGSIASDKDYNPIIILNVQDVYALDISDIDIRDVTPNNLIYKSTKKIVATVELVENLQAYLASIEFLDIFSGATTRVELLREIRSDIAYVWETIALDKDENLTEPAQFQKKLMLELFEEVKKESE